jgi:hypothetical protein
MRMVRIMAAKLHTHRIPPAKVADQELLLFFVVKNGPEGTGLDASPAEIAFGDIEDRRLQARILAEGSFRAGGHAFGLRALAAYDRLASAME